MEHFLDTVETIPEGCGIKSYGPMYIAETLIMILIIIGCSLLYRKLDQKHRKYMRWIMAALIVADEIFKHVCLLAGGNWLPKYLPLHLCSINIFLIVIHSITNSKLLENFIYVFCMATAPLAVLFMTWSTLPVMNFMHLHSWSIHVMLAAYPIMLIAGGDFRRDKKEFPKCLLLFVVLAVIVYFINVKCGTNFMFMMKTVTANPLTIFEHYFGSTIVGYPFFLAIGYLLLYVIPDHRKAKREAKEAAQKQ